MSTYSLTTEEAALLQRAAGMAGDRLARQENDAGVRSMEALIAQLRTERPPAIELNLLQREVLGKMLMNLSFDLLRADDDGHRGTGRGPGRTPVPGRARRDGSTHMKYGVVIRNMGPAATRETLGACAKAVEDAGFDAAFVVDHLAIPPDQTEGSGGRYFEPLTTLAYFAALTRTIRLGISVLVFPYRPAVYLAKQVATLQEVVGRTSDPRRGRRLAAPGVRSLGRGPAQAGRDHERNSRSRAPTVRQRREFLRRSAHLLPGIRLRPAAGTAAPSGSAAPVPPPSSAPSNTATATIRSGCNRESWRKSPRISAKRRRNVDAPCRS